MRSADIQLLQVPRSRLKQKGDRTFAIAGPWLWNNLPLVICTAPSVFAFKTALEKHFYIKAFESDLGET